MNTKTERMVLEQSRVSGMSPEEVYDILKNRAGWFSGDYDGDVFICFNRPETDAERVAREADELVRERERDERFRAEARAQQERQRIRNLFREWRASHPRHAEYKRLTRVMHAVGPKLAEDMAAYAELCDLLISERAFRNFERFMTP